MHQLLVHQPQFLVRLLQQPVLLEARVVLQLVQPLLPGPHLAVELGVMGYQFVYLLVLLFYHLLQGTDLLQELLTVPFLQVLALPDLLDLDLNLQVFPVQEIQFSLLVPVVLLQHDVLLSELGQF